MLTGGFPKVSCVTSMYICGQVKSIAVPDPREVEGADCHGPKDAKPHGTWKINHIVHPPAGKITEHKTFSTGAKRNSTKFNISP